MDESNLERLKAAYKIWDASKGGDTSAWLSLVGDGMRLMSTGGGNAELAFAGHRQSKQEVVAYLTAILQDWTMVHWTPESFVANGDKIAVFGRCAWTAKATGRTAEVHIAHLWRFEHGRAVELTEIFDTARAAAAATP